MPGQERAETATKADGKPAKGGDDAKKLTGEAGSADAVGGLFESPCLQRGEPLPYHPSAKSGDRIVAVFGICSSPGELFIFLQEISLAATPGPPIAHHQIEGSAPIAVDLSDLAPGRYTVLWKYGGFADEWQVFAEILVNGVARFRRYQTSQDSSPSNKIFVVIEVRS